MFKDLGVVLRYCLYISNIWTVQWNFFQKFFETAGFRKNRRLNRHFFSLWRCSEKILAVSYTNWPGGYDLNMILSKLSTIIRQTCTKLRKIWKKKTFLYRKAHSIFLGTAWKKIYITGILNLLCRCLELEKHQACDPTINTSWFNSLSSVQFHLYSCGNFFFSPYPKNPLPTSFIEEFLATKQIN